jgi:RNA polymerase sigma-70 factor, ECF subfamily
VTDDKELVQACLADDTSALAEFVRRFQSAVFGVCLKMLGHREDAEDVSQEVFLRAFRALHQWDSMRPLMPWLLTIAANRCRTWLSRRPTRLVSMEVVEELPGQAHLPERSDLAEELQRALKELREDYRLCFILFHYNELSLTEISRIVGSPEGTIKTWLHRARRELALGLQRRGYVSQGHHELR